MQVALTALEFWQDTYVATLHGLPSDARSAALAAHSGLLQHLITSLVVRAHLPPDVAHRATADARDLPEDVRMVCGRRGRLRGCSAVRGQAYALLWESALRTVWTHTASLITLIQLNWVTGCFDRMFVKSICCISCIHCDNSINTNNSINTVIKCGALLHCTMSTKPYAALFCNSPVFSACGSEATGWAGGLHSMWCMALWSAQWL